MSGSQAGPVIAFKLFSLKRDGSIGPLFINKKLRLQEGVWYDAEPHETKGFQFRPFWHSALLPIAPHLTTKGRIWKRVLVEDFTTYERCKAQGGTWVLSNRLMVLGDVESEYFPQGSEALG